MQIMDILDTEVGQFLSFVIRSPFSNKTQNEFNIQFILSGTVKSIETMLRSIVIIVLTFKSYPVEACSSITYNEVDCPGKICDGGCCTMPNYTCCTNNLFCAKNINFCRDYSRGGESNHSSRKEDFIYPSSFTILIIYYYNHF